MSKERKNSTTVSLTKDELVKLEALYRTAWGSSYNPDKTQRKFSKAFERIESQREESDA